MTYKTLWEVSARNKDTGEKVSFQVNADGWLEERILEVLSEVHPELEDISLKDLIAEREGLKEAC